MSERGWEGGEGEVAEGGDREMEKGRIGMNVVSVYSGTCGTLQKCPYFGGVLNTEVSL